jgi:hypothetical protein
MSTEVNPLLYRPKGYTVARLESSQRLFLLSPREVAFSRVWTEMAEEGDEEDEDEDDEEENGGRPIFNPMDPCILPIPYLSEQEWEHIRRFMELQKDFPITKDDLMFTIERADVPLSARIPAAYGALVPKDVQFWTKLWSGADYLDMPLFQDFLLAVLAEKIRNGTLEEGRVQLCLPIKPFHDQALAHSVDGKVERFFQQPVESTTTDTTKDG